MNARTHRRAILGATLICALGAGVATAQQSSAAAPAERARQLIAERQFQSALVELDKAVEADASYPVIYYLQGFALGGLGRHREALDAFVKAGDLSPGWADAHKMAAVAAINTRNLDVAWDQAIRAHQAGADVGDAFNQLLALERAPGDLDRQLGAARIFVMPLNTEKLAARQDNPFGVDVIGGAGDTGGAVNPFNTAASRATGVGNQQITESQSEFYDLLMQTRRSLADSKSFGVVPRQELAQYLLVIEVDQLGDTGQKSMKGYLKLIDPRSGEEAYRRILELRNISSRGDLYADIERYVDYLEEWLAKRAG